MTEKDIADLIEKKYTGDAYAFLPQVANGTGGHKERTADALVMSLWPSRGLHLYGFEIKVSRGDWRGELKKPEKAESIAQYCDFWYVVAPEGIANVEEVPPNWGLMCPSANGLCLQIKKQAVELKPKDISKVFLAALLRKASATITPEARTIEAYNKGRKEGMAARDHSNECKIKEFEELKIIVKQFEDASGVRINNRWTDTAKIGEAVNMVLSGRHLRLKDELKDLLETSEKITKSIDGAIKEMEVAAL
jgi:hypothetical protein